MNTFLDDLFNDGGALKALDDDWSKDFWGIDSEDLDLRFAQQGYEDKGYGHIQRIIANVGELLEKYFESLYDFNYGPHAEKKEDKLKLDGFQKKMKEVFKSNMVLFYTVAHLHDIGIGFPGIFEALAKYLKENGHSPLHIGELIHEYHHYASFIILMELSCVDGAIDITKAPFPYLKNLTDRGRKQDIEKLSDLNSKIDEIHRNNFEKSNGSIELKDFKVILAILCLLHKEIKEDDLQSILRKFKEKNAECIGIFNKWWYHFERGKAWTKKIYERFSRTNNLNNSTDFNDAELLKGQGNAIVDLQLVEALLQYGDKTEITIARLARRPLGKNRKSIKDMPLKKFIEDTEYDGKIEDITTEISQRVISDYARARACSYIPVLLVTVEQDEVPSNNKQTLELSIVIHYLRFDGDKAVFKYIRYQDEKDFYDLGFLRVICFHIPTFIHYYIMNNKKKLENPVFSIKLKKTEHKIKDNVGEIRKILTGNKDELEDFNLLEKAINGEFTDIDKDRFPLKNFPYTAQNCAAIDKFGKLLIKKEGKKQAFFESCDMDVPASFELLAVLNLFHKEE